MQHWMPGERGWITKEKGKGKGIGLFLFHYLRAYGFHHLSDIDQVENLIKYSLRVPNLLVN